MYFLQKVFSWCFCNIPLYQNISIESTLSWFIGQVFQNSGSNSQFFIAKLGQWGSENVVTEAMAAGWSFRSDENNS